MQTSEDNKCQNIEFKTMARRSKIRLFQTSAPDDVQQLSKTQKNAQYYPHIVDNNMSNYMIATNSSKIFT